jgi:hypothetical protein
MIRNILLQEARVGGLPSHFGVKKILDMLSNHFFWQHMRRDMSNDMLSSA